MNNFYEIVIGQIRFVNLERDFYRFFGQKP
jgi:hypothetical protein